MSLSSGVTPLTPKGYEAVEPRNAKPTLDKSKYRFEDCPRDGNCFFHAISKKLKTCSIEKSPQAIRCDLANFLRSGEGDVWWKTTTESQHVFEYKEWKNWKEKHGITQVVDESAYAPVKEDYIQYTLENGNTFVPLPFCRLNLILLFALLLRDVR